MAWLELIVGLGCLAALQAWLALPKGLELVRDRAELAPDVFYWMHYPGLRLEAVRLALRLVADHARLPAGKLRPGDRLKDLLEDQHVDSDYWCFWEYSLFAVEAETNQELEDWSVPDDPTVDDFIRRVLVCYPEATCL